MKFKHEIIKGSANYLLFCLNQLDEGGHALTASEQLALYGPCGAVAWAPTKKALIRLCEKNGLELV